MRDKVATIVQSAMGRAVSDTKAGIMPPDPHLYGDLILALEVDGVKTCTYKMPCNLRKYGLCVKPIECEDQVPATIADLIEVK